MATAADGTSRLTLFAMLVSGTGAGLSGDALSGAALSDLVGWHRAATARDRQGMAANTR